MEFTSKAADCPKPTDQAKRAIRGLFEAMWALEFGRLSVPLTSHFISTRTSSLHDYGAPFSHLFTELKISLIEVHISAIELEISPIHLKISSNQLEISTIRPI